MARLYLPQFEARKDGRESDHAVDARAIDAAFRILASGLNSGLDESNLAPSVMFSAAAGDLASRYTHVSMRETVWAAGGTDPTGATLTGIVGIVGGAGWILDSANVVGQAPTAVPVSVSVTAGATGTGTTLVAATSLTPRGDLAYAPSSYYGTRASHGHFDARLTPATPAPTLTAGWVVKVSATATSSHVDWLTIDLTFKVPHAA